MHERSGPAGGTTSPAIGAARLSAFLRQHDLPKAFAAVIDQHYLPLAGWLQTRCKPGRVFLLGINGAQGTGKSTLADFLGLALKSAGLRVINLSLDDFYLARQAREQLAADVHALFAVRGVPGTHDTRLLSQTLDRLSNLGDGQPLRLPVFDKATDDRAPADAWRIVTGPVDVIILEGWCVGTPAQSENELRQPINALEAAEDRDGTWRRSVNDALAEHYAPIFASLDALCYLKVPGIDTIIEWRAEQERKLARQRSGPGLMSRDQLLRFIQHYERLTREALDRLPGTADVVIELDRNHGCVSSRYRRGS